MKIEHSEIQTEAFPIRVDDGFFKQLPSDGLQDTDHFDVGASADHSFEALRAHTFVGLSDLLHLPHLTVLSELYSNNPTAENVLSRFVGFQIDALGEFSALSLQFSVDLGRVRLNLALLFLVLADFVVHKAARKLTV